MRSLALCICLPALAGLAGGATGAGGPALSGARACPGQPGYTCETLTVPLDYSGRLLGKLGLVVAVRVGGTAPKGVLFVLSGGPGQPGVGAIARVARRLGAAATQYRLVMIDQRGTGAGALDCPELQRQMGFSDLRPPTPAAVRACAAAIGPKRAFFGTDDVVRDLDQLRRALGQTRIAIDGTSYGTYVAERYALTYPGRVSRLVLDSVVPHAASGQLETLAFPRVAQVLRIVCKERTCAGDPAADLAADVARYHAGPQLLDAIVLLSVIDPTYRTQVDLPRVLHEARLGNPRPMNGMLAAIHDAEASEPASDLSQGLHASALCEDWTFPWGGWSAPLAGRSAALRRYAASLPRSAFWPFDRATVTGNGIMQQCLYWPPTPAGPQPERAKLPRVATLILAGDRDLSTPLPWPRLELKAAPGARFVFVRGSGHSTQRTDAGQAAVQRFLLGTS